MKHTPPSRAFLSLFVLVTMLEIIGDETANRLLHYGCKPLIMGLLLVWSWRQRTTTNVPGVRLLRFGMLFALLGDILLMIREVDFFAQGLGAFLVMQLCYSIAFGQQIRANRSPNSFTIIALTALPFLLYAGTFYASLLPAFRHDSTLSGLRWPVLIYAICLCLMGLMAALRRGVSHHAYVLVGALLFIASDSAIAVQAFLTPFPGNTPFIMVTYAAAQYLIVVYTHVPMSGFTRQIA